MRNCYALLLFFLLGLIHTSQADNFAYYRNGKLTAMPRADWSRLFVTTKQQPTAATMKAYQALVPSSIARASAPEAHLPNNGFVLNVALGRVDETNYRTVLGNLLNQKDVVSVLPAFIVPGFDASDPIYVSGKILMHVPTASVAAIRSTISATGAEVAEALPMGKETVLVVTLPTHSDVFAASRTLYEKTGARIVEPNMIFKGHNDYVPNDPFYSLQYFLSQRNNADVDAPEAWDLLLGRVC
jgi:hypothetical protein